MICAARNDAPGFRAESWAEGRERREDGADDRYRPTNLGVYALSGPAGQGRVSRGAAASGGVAEPKQLFKTTDGIDQSTRQKSLAR